MRNPMAIAALVAVSAMIAAPAGAQTAAAQTVSVARDISPVVRIALDGKSDVQINDEIAAAASKVCGGSAGGDCYYETLLDAKNQFYAYIHARQAPVGRVDAATSGADLVRVSVAGKSPAEVDREIRAAAQKVCKAASTDAIDFAECVSAATDNANAQRQQLSSRVAKPEVLASN
ncbi:hypothetical protein [Phenylobacterium montanum]|uniref:UrcA family protein n=1 Tax=Phenylobacterium montanum TaxID=2823693 RepID=A0A975ISV8_9CAUL|nr:hypothetical protein [Caulobacter sp. S6]QUD86133.1 hypothetical protein KCG34_13590 [Caulobacter sp. S6]